MTDEEKAEEYIMREDVVTENDRVPFDNGYGWQTVSFENEVKRAYLDGLIEGRKEKWHDLRENSKDLPKHSGEYWCKWEDGTYSTVHYFGDNGFGNYVIADSGFGSYVIAWCELPRFEE